MVRIVHLVDRPDAAGILAAWFEETWAPWYGPDGDGDAAVDLAACESRDRVPLCLVALEDEGRVLGTVSLRETSVGDDVAPGPWLAALLVGEPFRGRGVASRLIAALEAEAQRLGFAAVYTSASDLERPLLGRG